MKEKGESSIIEIDQRIQTYAYSSKLFTFVILITCYFQSKLMQNTLNENSELQHEHSKAKVDKGFDALFQWLRSAGSSFPMLEMKEYGHDYRGVHAARDIAPEQCIVEVPFRFIMTTEVAKASDIGRRIVSSGCMLRSKHSYLACFLLYERAKGNNSFWHAYIDTLPKDYANMPINFSQEERAMLKGSMCIEKIGTRIQSLREEYETLCQHVPNFARFSLKEFTWARHAVITRIFGLFVGGLKTEGLVPVADLLNHKRSRDTKWTFDNNKNAFTIINTRPLSKGEQIFDSYGRKCNSRFFVNYGFALEENEDNEAVLNISVDSNDLIYGQKCRLLANDSAGTQRSFQVPASTRERSTRKMLSFARFVCASEQDIQSYPSHYAINVEDLAHFTISNEIAMLQLIRQSALDSLHGFDTTIQEDNQLLLKDSLSFNERNSILMRRGEKNVCDFFVRLADTCIPLLKMKWTDFQLAAVGPNGSNGEFDGYISDVVRPLISRGY